MLAAGIIPLTDELRNSEGKFNTAALSIAGIGLATSEVLPVLAMFKIAFPKIAATVASSTAAIAAAWGAMVTAILIGAQQIKSNLGIDLFSGNIISNIQGLATSDFMVNRGIDKGIESMKKMGMDKPITDKLIQDALKVNESKYNAVPKNFDIPKVSRGGSTSPRVQEEKEILNAYDKQLEVIQKIKDELALNVGLIGKEYQLNAELIKAYQELRFLQSGQNLKDMGIISGDNTMPLRDLSTFTGGTSFIQSKDMMVMIESMITPISESFQNAFSNITSTISSLSVFFDEAGQNFISDLIEGFNRIAGIVQFIAGVFDTIKSVNSIISTVTSIFGLGFAPANMISPRVSTSTNVYISANMDGLTFLKSNMPLYNNYKSYRRL